MFAVYFKVSKKISTIIFLDCDNEDILIFHEERYFRNLECVKT